jgi:hypothetical protein
MGNREMEFAGGHIQASFDPLEFTGGEAEAKAARDRRYRELVKHGYRAKRFVLRGQLKKHSGFGQPDGRVRDVYMIDAYPPDRSDEYRYEPAQIRLRQE